MRREFFKKLPLALTGGFSLFLTLDAGLFIMLALAHFLENATAGALPLKPFERTFQGLIFADTYLGHCYPSPRSRQWPAGSKAHSTETTAQLYSQRCNESTFFSNSGGRPAEGPTDQAMRSASCVPPRMWKWRWGTDWHASGPQFETTR